MSTETPNTEMTWMPEARQIAAQCWCDPETSGIEMDARLAEACARRIASWMEEAARQALGVDYYRGLLSECGAAIGKEAYTQDDGGVVPDVLVAKVPELVKKQTAELAQVTTARAETQAVLTRMQADLASLCESRDEATEALARNSEWLDHHKGALDSIRAERDAALRRVREIEVSALATLQSWDALRSAHDGRDESERRAFADSIAALKARLDAAEKGGRS